jgi:hypothetical protein
VLTSSLTSQLIVFLWVSFVEPFVRNQNKQTEENNPKQLSREAVEKGAVKRYQFRSIKTRIWCLQYVHFKAEMNVWIYHLMMLCASFSYMCLCIASFNSISYIFLTKWLINYLWNCFSLSILNISIEVAWVIHLAFTSCMALKFPCSICLVEGILAVRFHPTHVSGEM